MSVTKRMLILLLLLLVQRGDFYPTPMMNKKKPLDSDKPSSIEVKITWDNTSKGKGFEFSSDHKENTKPPSSTENSQLWNSQSDFSNPSSDWGGWNKNEMNNGWNPSKSWGWSNSNNMNSDYSYCCDHSDSSRWWNNQPQADDSDDGNKAAKKHGYNNPSKWRPDLWLRFIKVGRKDFVKN